MCKIELTVIQGNAAQSELWQTRPEFETRSAGGITFFYRSDPESERALAFAVNGNYLLLAAREDLMAGALQLMAGSKDQPDPSAQIAIDCNCLGKIVNASVTRAANKVGTPLFTM